ncbi:Utp21 specific WD40 associated putative domain-containing protein [Schizophyllum amplum]|uniref:Utp21 specific WD40 associated putative domain-containing protein n=1 Tax=Schizophyllum amplum TaxID=97359 RepID=A0A550CCQ1_9AGAR|nr:Utp21 specific WD40 associated putative domain-containing protein [Auriculariopsis ampla]
MAATSTMDTRSRKRVRRESQPAAVSPQLFAPFRALGIITNHVPFALQARSHKGAVDGPRVHLLTSVGRSWALWEGGKMGLLFVGEPAPAPITALAMDGDAVWAAAGTHLIKYARGKEVLRATNPYATPLASATVFGNHILALDDPGRRLLVFATADGTLAADISFPPGFTASRVLHPATYLNKVLVASLEGGLQLWNIRDRVHIHDFDPASLSPSPSPSAITALVQAPAIDVVGIGFADGRVVVHDVRADERLMVFSVENLIRTLAFRTDGEPILVAGDASGALSIWDLNAPPRLLHMIHGAHDAAITSVDWVPGQPLLVSAGEDNAVKQWLFDAPHAAPRLLKSRAGHRAPPTLVRFYGTDGKQVLSAGTDRALRLTSLVREARGCEMAQGSLSKKNTTLSKLGPITSLACEPARSKDWDDVVTAHAGDRFARTWTTQNKRLGKYALEGEGVVRTTALTACGTFALAAGAGGVVRMWNAQSGVMRRTFGVGDFGAGPTQPSTAASGGKAIKGTTANGKTHTTGIRKQAHRTITGIATDALNTVLVASTLDGTLNFFDFHTAELLHTLTITSTTSSNTSSAQPSTSYASSTSTSYASSASTATPPAITALHLHRDSGLLALSCDDLAVRIVDLETRAVVRVLKGFGGRVVDVTFSPDARWLVAASLDAAVRTFDVPSGRLVDVFRCVSEGSTTTSPSTPTSVAFSPAGDFLATTHVDSVGVFLWVNRAQFSDVSLQGVVEGADTAVALPGMQGDAEEEALASLSALTVQDPIASLPPTATPPQLAGDLVTLTLLPRARWMTLLNLDVIQLRNKPKEPPKAPEKAPFFLPTVPGVAPTFDLTATSTNGASAEAASSTEKHTRRLDSLESSFARTLAEEDPKGNYPSLFTIIKTLSPAALDAELRTIILPAQQARLLHALTQRLRARRDFEAVQAVMGVVLKVWGESLVGGMGTFGATRRPLDASMDDEDTSEDLHAALAELRAVQAKESERVLGLVAASLGTLGFIRETL